MPQIRHAGRVYYCNRSRPSGRLLGRRLLEQRYAGQYINWGIATLSDGLGMSALNNWQAVARASNKRIALQVMRTAGVPCPAVVDISGDPPYPFVMRTERHRAGQGFWLCDSPQDINEAVDNGASHSMEYIHPAREFRVHVAFNNSIKLTEKMHSHDNLGGSYSWLHADDPRCPSGPRTFRNGWRFRYPVDFGYRPTLRATARQAVNALGLDFGAVDILWLEDEGRDGFRVLEVNTAPDLTSGSDVLSRYVTAFMNNA